MTLLPFIIACAYLPNGDKCGAWAGATFHTDVEICERELQDSMETLLEQTARMGGYVYWIKGECSPVTKEGQK